MVDPISGTSYNRIEPTSPKEPKKAEGKAEHAGHSGRSSEDSISVSFNIYGNLNQVQDSVKVLYQEVRSQLEEYFGVTQKSEEAQAEFEPPEDASAQELLEFYNPANTANRIANFATGYFEAYQQNHADASEEENINGFTTLLQNAIDQGFQEAEKILGDFDELGEIGDSIKETYRNVVRNLQNFRDEYLQNLRGEQPEQPQQPADNADDIETIIPVE